MLKDPLRNRQFYSVINSRFYCPALCVSLGALQVHVTSWFSLIKALHKTVREALLLFSRFGAAFTSPCVLYCAVFTHRGASVTYVCLSGVDSLHVFVLILFLPTNVFHFYSQLRIRHKLSEALESTAGLPPTFYIWTLLTERDDARKMPRVLVAFWFFCPHYLKNIYML